MPNPDLSKPNPDLSNMYLDLIQTLRPGLILTYLLDA